MYATKTEADIAVYREDINKTGCHAHCLMVPEGTTIQLFLVLVAICRDVNFLLRENCSQMPRHRALAMPELQIVLHSTHNIKNICLLLHLNQWKPTNCPRPYLSSLSIRRSALTNPCIQSQCHHFPTNGASVHRCSLSGINGTNHNR
jgi:hypothetical protein